MNREQAREHHDRLLALIPIVLAFAQGKNVQWKIDTQKNWTDTKDPNFNLTAYGDRTLYWRIKPEPVEIEVWVCHTPHTVMPTFDDDATSYMQDVTVGQRSLNAPPEKYAQHWRKIKMQEVLK